jgi:hypothetical protein
LHHTGAIYLSTKFSGLATPFVQMCRSGKGGHPSDALVVRGEAKGDISAEPKGSTRNGVLFLGEAVNDGGQVGQPLCSRECSSTRTNARQRSGGYEPPRLMGEVFSKFRQHPRGRSAHAERPWQSVKKYECSLNRGATF